MMRPLRFVLVSSLALLACLATAEAGRRILDGYYVWRLGLQKDPDSKDLTWSDGRSTEALLRSIELDSDADRSWFSERPQPPQTTSPEWAADRLADFNEQVNYVWNAARLEDLRRYGYFDKYRGRLDEIFTFRAPNDSPYPFYRLYPEIDSGFGFTNRRGWRSGSVADRKPPDVIRIGVIGDSTTSSYPAMVEHWLNVWASRRNLGVRFEVLNAARPAAGAFDAAGILEFELGPADPDYLIIYGFGNGIFFADGLIKMPPGIIKAQPATWTGKSPGIFSGVSTRLASRLEPVARWSAAAGFLRARVLGRHGDTLRSEPSKPATRVVFPPGIDEDAPDPEKIASAPNNGLMGLETYLQALNKMDQIAKARDIRLLVSTFRIMAFDGMDADRGVYASFNESWWPYTYAQIRRLMAFYNRTLRAWATGKGQVLIEVDERMPWRPELYGDSMHELPSGEALHAWVVFQQLLPLIRNDLTSHRIPRPARDSNADVGSYWTIERTKLTSIIGEAKLAAGSPAALPPAADDIPGAFMLSGITLAYAKAQIVAGDVPLIRTAPEPSGYAARVPFGRSGLPSLTGRALLSVRLRVNDGGITVGVLNKSGQKFHSYANVFRTPDIQEVHLTIEDLSDVGSLVVANNRPGEMAASVVELHSVVLKRLPK